MLTCQGKANVLHRANYLYYVVLHLFMQYVNITYKKLKPSHSQCNQTGSNNILKQGSNDISGCSGYKAESLLTSVLSIINLHVSFVPAGFTLLHVLQYMQVWILQTVPLCGSNTDEIIGYSSPLKTHFLAQCEASTTGLRLRKSQACFSEELNESQRMFSHVAKNVCKGGLLWSCSDITIWHQFAHIDHLSCHSSEK